jgi:hypothetical protein
VIDMIPVGHRRAPHRGCNSPTAYFALRLFEDKKTEMSSTIQTAFDNQGRVVQQVGKATDAWIRLESQIEMEMKIRDRIRATV